MRWPIRQAILCVVLISIGSGCGAIGTKQPIYDPAKDLVHDGRLVGKWVWIGAMGFPEGELAISRQDKTYLLRIADLQSNAPNEQHDWTVDLVPMGKFRCLFFRSEGEGTQLLPAYRVEFADHGNEIHLSLLNTLYIGHFLQMHPGTLRYEEAPGFFTTRPSTTRPATEPSTQPTAANLILTDDPAKIRRFLIQHQDDRDWFLKPWILYRTTDSTSL